MLQSQTHFWTVYVPDICEKGGGRMNKPNSIYLSYGTSNQKVYNADEMDAWIEQEFADLRNKLACADGVNRELMERLKNVGEK